jgi:hypothetical protein
LSDLEFTPKELEENGTKWRDFITRLIERIYAVRDITFTVGHPLRYRCDQDYDNEDALIEKATITDNQSNKHNFFPSHIHYLVYLSVFISWCCSAIEKHEHEVRDDVGATDDKDDDDVEPSDELDFVEFSRGLSFIYQKKTFDLFVCLLVQVEKGDIFVIGEGQAIVVCAWLSLKEVSLLLATIVKKVALSSMNEGRKLLTESQIEHIGNKILDTLLQIRHKGAIEKTAMGLQAICEVLFACKDPKLHNLPVKWLNFLYLNSMHLITHFHVLSFFLSLTSSF